MYDVIFVFIFGEVGQTADLTAFDVGLLKAHAGLEPLARVADDCERTGLS